MAVATFSKLGRLVAAFGALLGVAPLMIDDTASARALNSYALVLEDATLRTEARHERLYGIHIPDAGRRCRTNVLPVRRGSRAALTLDFKIQGFVHCDPQSVNGEGSLNAVCHAGRGAFDDGEDLAAYLLERGWALALPGAPFAHHALERFVRHNYRGVWGTPLDSVTRP
jgi:endonuclease YncB( thermonuclease family)